MDIFNRPKIDEFQKGLIAKSFAIEKSEQEIEFENQISKGEIDVVSADDLKESFGGVFYKAEDVAKLENQIDTLIEKGQKEYLEEEEFNVLEKSTKDFSKLEQVALVTPKGYVKVFVQKQEQEEQE
jgi:hypothetical protein